MRLPSARTARRCAAVVLVVAAILMAVVPASDDSAPMVVAAHALAPGTALSPSDVRVVRVPAHVLPSGVVRDVTGRTLVGGAGEGEPITESRLVGAEYLRLVGPDSAAVPLRLTESGVVEALRPGSRVDVVTRRGRGRQPTLLARDGVVVSARDEVAVIALPRDSAAEVAAMSLEQPVTVTLR